MAYYVYRTCRKKVAKSQEKNPPNFWWDHFWTQNFFQILPGGRCLESKLRMMRKSSKRRICSMYSKAAVSIFPVFTSFSAGFSVISFRFWFSPLLIKCFFHQGAELRGSHMERSRAEKRRFDFFIWAGNCLSFRTPPRYSKQNNCVMRGCLKSPERLWGPPQA